MSLNPITREEKFLAKAGGEDVGELKPITRREKFLDRIAGGGGESEVFTVHIALNSMTEPPTSEETYEEIVEALVAGKRVVLDLNYGNGYVHFYGQISSYGDLRCIFATILPENGIYMGDPPTVIRIAVNNDNTVETTMTPLATPEQVETMLGGIENGTY